MSIPAVTPTPIEHLQRLSSSACALWVKRDDLTDAEYGGNKVRKLPHLFLEAERARARRLVLVAPAGSHQVLATALFGRKLGLSVAAVLTPQARTEHAAEVLRASLGLGVEAVAARPAQVPRALLRLRRRGDFRVPIGGSSARSLRGHIDAVQELADDVAAGRAPEPELVVVPLASAGTAVSLAAGLARQRLRARVVGVCASNGRAIASALVLAQLARLSRCAPGLVAGAAARLQIEPRYLGRGYSIPTEESERAAELGRQSGLTLEPAYTAKAFAAALDLVQRGRARNVLFWQTHSSAPLAPLLREAPPEGALPPSLRSLLLQGAPCASW
jgi:D-cysteine desulfhydrase